MTLLTNTYFVNAHNYHKKVVFTLFALSLCFIVNAQHDTLTQKLQYEIQRNEQINSISEDKTNEVNNLKISGYTQMHYQYGEEQAILRVGRPNENPNSSFNRIGLRRNRIKLTYNKGIGTSIFQLDVTEKGATLKDAYITIAEPYLKLFTITAGLFNRPFGYEVVVSSSQRVSIERSVIIQTLFPGERDLGVMLSARPDKHSKWNFLKLDMGLFAGNSSNMETDNKKDFIGHLSVNPTSVNNFIWSGGISYYNGGVYQGSRNIFRTVDNGFVIDSSIYNIGKYAKREYLGANIQFKLETPLGCSELTSEYVFGTQPGIRNSSKSPDDSKLDTEDVYIRNIQGGYINLVQELGLKNLSGIIKYDWYDPNTRVKGSNIGSNYTGIGDVNYDVLGIGLQWKINSNTKITAYYEFISNETSPNLVGYDDGRKDNVLSVRLQYQY